MIYFDNAATTKIHPQVLEEMYEAYKTISGNPSSVYSLGQEAKGAIEHARQTIANIMGVKPKEIYFTSGGTESDNWAIRGLLKASKKNHLITSTIEHHAVLHTAEYLRENGAKVDYVKVDKDGILNLEELESLISEDTGLISIMTANNEIGTIEPIEEISKIAKAHNVLFHSDAVQGFFNTDIDFKKLDAASMSAHKIRGPKGIGIMYLRDGIKIDNLIFGGSQERGKRPGTENVQGIIGLSKACQIKSQNDNRAYVKSLRDYLIKNLEDLKIKINGSLEKRLVGNVNFILEGIPQNITLMKLDLAGICASAGSACTAGSLSPSHVLKAIGLSDEDAASSIRISLNEENTKEEIDVLINLLKNEVKNE